MHAVRFPCYLCVDVWRRAHRAEVMGTFTSRRITATDAVTPPSTRSLLTMAIETAKPDETDCLYRRYSTYFLDEHKASNGRSIRKYVSASLDAGRFYWVGANRSIGAHPGAAILHGPGPARYRRISPPGGRYDRPGAGPDLCWIAFQAAGGAVADRWALDVGQDENLETGRP